MSENLSSQPTGQEKPQDLYVADEIIEQGNSRVEISRVGGTILSWTVDGQEIIPKLFKKVNQETGKASYRGGMPICFPFFGPSPEGMKSIPQHGWLRNSEMEIIESGENEITFSQENKPTDEYPWQLKTTLQYKITDDSLEVILQITRLSDGQQSPAPIDPALHPYFAIDKNSQTKVDQQEINFSSEARGLDITDDSDITIDTKAGTVKMTTEEFSKLWVWSDNPEEYGCLEPVLADLKNFNTTSGIFLKIDEKINLKMKLALLNK